MFLFHHQVCVQLSSRPSLSNLHVLWTRNIFECDQSNVLLARIIFFCIFKLLFSSFFYTANSGADSFTSPTASTVQKVKLVTTVSLRRHHGLCGSNKLLYKWCAKSMGRPKFRPPQLLHFSTDLNEIWNRERYSRYDPTRKVWLMWYDGKEVYVRRAFSVTFCVLSFFCILDHAYRSHQKNRSRPFMAQKACFRVR